MKIVISSSGPTLDSTVDPRFGRAAYLLIVESEDGSLLEVIDNSSGRDAAQGAGISAAALVADKGVKAVLTGRLGPKAMAVVEKAGIEVVSDVHGTVRDAVARFTGAAPAGSVSAAPGSTGEDAATVSRSPEAGRGMMSNGPEAAFGGGKGLGGGRRRKEGCGCAGRGRGAGRRGSGTCGRDR